MNSFQSLSTRKYRLSVIRYRIKSGLHASNPFKRLFDYIFSAVWYRLPTEMRKALFTGQNFYCPTCQSRLRKFLSLHRSYHLYCPACQSLQRDRLGWILLQSEYIKITQAVNSMLHIAPEPGLSSRLRKIEGLDYISADLYNTKAMVQMDISNIQYPNDSFDLIYCSHVLEHVGDDHQAMRELRRVLKPGGVAIIMVPIDVEETIEDPSITDPFEREKLFGQFDHVRRYGNDFIQRLQLANFEVVTITTGSLVTPDEVKTMGLIAGETIFLCHKAKND